MEESSIDTVKPYLYGMRPLTYNSRGMDYFRLRGIHLSNPPMDIMTAMNGCIAALIRDGVHGMIIQVQYTRMFPKQRRFIKGLSIPKGSAVRLFDAGSVMGIAEGVETALAASILFDIPVWATLGCARLKTWMLPQGTKKVYIFGDNNKNGVGQEACHGLSDRMKYYGVKAQVLYPLKTDTDWNDVLKEKLNGNHKQEKIYA